MPIDLTEAIDRHRRGDLELAARIYEAALAENPDRDDALHLRGLVALQRGDAPRAATLIARAIAVRPGVADYYSTLGEAYWALKQPDRAVECFRESLRIRRDNPETLSNLGSTLLAQGDIDGAIDCFREALRLRPDLAAAHNNLGDALARKGDTTGALEHLQRAVRLDPAAAEAHSNLGLLLLERDLPEQALVHCREAVRLRPGFITARVNLGNVLQTLDRLAEAEACLRAAVELDPTRAPGHAALAGVLEELGDLEGSLRSLREALKHDPRHAGALARLATRLRGALPPADQAAIENLLTGPGLPPLLRWPLLFGLAQVFDARAEFGRAAEAAAEANALQAADFTRRGLAYDPAAYTVFVDRMIAAFSSDFFSRARGWGLETERPVFVVGMPRSGTSLVEQILASHPRVWGAGELQLARNTFRAIPEATGRRGLPHECVAHLDQRAISQLAQAHLERLAQRNARADRIVDKMPENTLYLGLLAALFPRARFIHCRRDLRDVALSCWITNFGQVRWACDQRHIASRAAEYCRIMNHWRRALPVPVLDVDYESIVADLETAARKLIEWCGLDWDPACLRFHQTKRPVRTASVAQVRTPIYGSSIGRWKNFEPYLGTMFMALERT